MSQEYDFYGNFLKHHALVPDGAGNTDGNIASNSSSEITRPLPQVELLRTVIGRLDLICFVGLDNRDSVSGYEWTSVNSDDLPVSEEAQKFIGSGLLKVIFLKWSEDNVLVGVANHKKRILFNINMEFKVPEYQAQSNEQEVFQNVQLELPEKGLTDLNVITGVIENCSKMLIDRSSPS